LGDQVRRHPDRILNNMQKTSTLLETGNYALPFVSIITLKHWVIVYGEQMILLSYMKGRHLKMSRSFPFSVSNILRRFCCQSFQEGRQMSFQNNRPNNHGWILVFALAKKQQIHAGILLGVSYMFHF